MKPLLILLFITALFACNRPRTIPDDTLADITREIFLANAYRGSSKSVFPISDTIDFYTPIFEKYGYRPSDFSYTINSLSRRKSIRFTDILEEVALQLSREDSILMATIALRDTVEQRMAHYYQQKVPSDSSWRFTRLGNPDKPDIVLPVKPGRYRIEFVYDLDTASKNTNLRYAHYLLNRSKVETDHYFLGYSKGIHRNAKIDAQITDPTAEELQIHFASSSATKEQNIKLKIDSLKITYFMPSAAAQDSLIREKIPYHSWFPIHEPKTHQRNDSLWKEVISTPHSDTTRVVTKRDSTVRHGGNPVGSPLRK